MRSKTKNYLQDYNFFLSEVLEPTKDEIEEIIESAGGKIVEKVLKKDNPVIICHKSFDREAIKNYKAKSFKVYNVDLILESVFKQELDLDKTKYKI
jgi:hypothetical protein